MFEEELVKLHSKKESLKLQANLILTKYGLILNYWTPEAENKEAIKAFNKMCDLGIRVYPKENSNLEAIVDYKKWYSLQQDIYQISIKIKIINMIIKGFSEVKIKKLLNYKESASLYQIINEN